MFGWTIKESSLYDSVSTGLSIVGSLIGLYILKKLLKLSEITIVIISLSADLIGTLFIAFAHKGWHMYIAGVITMLRGLIPSMNHSLLSQIVDKSETGKLFSLTNMFEDVSILFASQIYTTFYTSTFQYFAGAFALLSACMLFMGAILAM